MSTPGELATELTAWSATMHARVRVAQEAWARSFIDEVKRNAADIPGIRADYLDSFYTDTSDHGIDIVTEAGSTAPEDNRLEYGFVGSDSSGRTYDRPPHPHWRPAFDLMGELTLEEILATALDVT